MKQMVSYSVHASAACGVVKNNTVRRSGEKKSSTGVMSTLLHDGFSAHVSITPTIHRNLQTLGLFQQTLCAF